jgi:hypothetical protein
MKLKEGITGAIRATVECPFRLVMDKPDDHYRRTLHVRERNYGVQFFKKIQHILKLILLLIPHNLDVFRFKPVIKNIRKSHDLLAHCV